MIPMSHKTSLILFLALLALLGGTYLLLPESSPIPAESLEKPSLSMPVLPTGVSDFDMVKIDDHEAVFEWTEADGRRWRARLSREEFQRAVRAFVEGE